MIAPLWLAHHRGEGLQRCFNLFGVRCCARCSGLLPGLLVTLIVEARLRVVWPTRWALALEVLLVVPGSWDALRGVAAPALGSNGVRWLTGAALGVALAHAANVGLTRGYGAPEALFPLLAAGVTGLGVLAQQRGQLTDGG